jgi:asparagine N-glycosylation enzyme membrane subunit Stt3
VLKNKKFYLIFLGRNKMSKEEVVAEREKKTIAFVKGKISLAYYLILAILIGVNIYIRTLPMKILQGTGKPGLWDVTRNNWTIGPDLDPFLFLRSAKYIVENGSLMVVDYFRYVPLGFQTASETKLLPYMIAWLYDLIRGFQNVTVEYAAVIFPVVMSVFTAIFFFLLVRKIFESRGKSVSNITALIATAFMIVLPSLLSRTIAGIPEKESAGFTFFFAAFYFFLSAWKAKKTYSSVILGVVAGISTALMGLIWGAWVFIFIVLSTATFAAFILGKVERKEFLVYSCWIISTLLFTLPFTVRYTLTSLLTSSSSGLAFGVWFFLIVDFILFKTRVKDTKSVVSLKEKIRIPQEFISIILAFLLLMVTTSFLFGIGFIPGIVKDVIVHLTTPYEDRIAFTVAENRQPYYISEWKESFGPLIQGTPLFFWLFFVGSIFLFFETVGNLKKLEKWLLTGLYTLFLFGLIFSRYSSSSQLNGVNSLSNIVYFGGIILFICGFAYVYYRYRKEKNADLLKSIDFNYILVFILFFLTIIAARSAVRLIMVLAPIAAIIVGYFIVEIASKAIKEEEEVMKIVIWGVALLVLVASFYTVYYYYQATSNSARAYIPSSYSIQWQYAMQWVRENTPKDAVFSHWWDYGYWVQTMGERATVLDGGNAIGYWDHLMGRHILTGKTEKEALELMYTHNSTYLLIDSSDIGKYAAYSSIGSDENYDRYSWMGTFILNPEATQETRNETIYLYQGGVATDQDIFWNDNMTQLQMPAQRAGVGGIQVPVTPVGNESIIFGQPTAIFVYNNQYIKIPMRYLYYNGKEYDFKSGLKSGIFIIPRIMQQSNGGITVNNIGAALYLSEKNLDALWVQLFLLGKNKQFELVHSEPNLIISNLRQQGLVIGDFAVFSEVLGPIKIWKANFTDDIHIVPEYLEVNYPNTELAIAGRPF